MTNIDTWLAAAILDAEQRGLPELTPLLEGLAAAARELRAADLNQSAAGTAASGGPTASPEAERP